MALNFNRSWPEYKDGVGSLTESWIGSKKFSYLTNQAVYEVLVDFVFYNGDSFDIAYKMFPHTRYTELVQ